MTRQDCLNKILLLSDLQLEELINSWENTVIKRLEGGPIPGDPTRSIPELPIVENLLKINDLEDQGLPADTDYLNFLNTLPSNLRLSKNSDYDMYLSWKLNGKPKNFEEAKLKNMVGFNSDDNSWHGNTIAWDNEKGIGYFLKSKQHKSIQKELDLYNNNLIPAINGTPFKDLFEIADDPDRPGFLMYKRKTGNESVEKKQQGGVLNVEEELLKILPTDEYLKLTIKNYSEFNKL